MITHWKIITQMITKLQEKDHPFIENDHWIIGKWSLKMIGHLLDYGQPIIEKWSLI